MNNNLTIYDLNFILHKKIDFFDLVDLHSRNWYFQDFMNNLRKFQQKSCIKH
ncbi:hypothetical protein sm9_0654 [Methanobrevibacter millerae]|uniref:Uncharacterized protein n=1 Tax=Methanobrevibacter millerae TaxID=230361 RepID=A0A0U2TRA1_9EURY|nr:hypothetical protein sm9_0654 [Methanobrevibacter millerae]